MSKKADALETQMKQHEAVSRTLVLSRTPVVIRLNIRQFRSYAARFKVLDPTTTKSPYSEMLHGIMVTTTARLVESIQNCAVGYTQGGEINLLVVDWESPNTQQWLNGDTQQMVSSAAVTASNVFNHQMAQLGALNSRRDYVEFDACTFNVPMDQVTNHFVWRQRMAATASIIALGEFCFSLRELSGKTSRDIQDMLLNQQGVDWTKLPTWQQHGACVVFEGPRGATLDENVPAFDTNSEYISKFLYPTTFPPNE